MTERQTQYKNQGKDSEISRKNRTDHGLTLRREKREDALSKRRNIVEIPDEENTSSDVPSQNLMTLEETIIGAQSSGPQTKLLAITNARKLLSFKRNPPTEEMINFGILPILVNCLQSTDTDLQLEATWALTNITSGSSEQTKAVVDSNAVPFLLQLMSSPSLNVCDQAIWALANIVGDGPHFRDYCIELGILTPLLEFVQPDVPVSFLRNAIWVLVNLCRYKDPPPSRELIKALLEPLSGLIHHDDTGILADTLQAISYLLGSGNEAIEIVLEANILSALISLLGHSEDKVKSAALRACGNITAGTDKQTQAVLDYGVLQYMPALLTHTKDKINKDAVWLISNITAGESNQVQAIINSGLMKYVVNLLSRGAFQTQREAARAISNIAVVGDPLQVLHLVHENYLPAACSLLTVKDTSVLQVILDAIHSTLLKLPDHTNELCQQIEECGGLNKIEGLQTHESEYIYKTVFEIIDEYFSQDEELLSFNAAEPIQFNINHARPNRQFQF